jgi:quercetin dioxygenase-like cupin family protein
MIHVIRIRLVAAVAVVALGGIASGAAADRGYQPFVTDFPHGVAAGASRGAELPIAAKPMAFGTIRTPMTLHVKPGAMIVESFTVAPGGNFGWHVHGSPVAVVVASGTLTVFDPTIDHCTPFKVSKGEAFIEPANHLHLARNDGAKPATVYATYLGVPKRASANKPGQPPAGCDA